MRCVVLGDVGTKDFYHVGDEAMTEHALDVLRASNPDHITVVGSDVHTTKDRFGTDAVSPIGFGWRKPEQWRADRLTSIMEALNGGSSLPRNDSAWGVIDAVKNSSGVLIAGGGNITTRFPHHLYERVALGKIARHFDVPYVVSGQTYGPELNDRHFQLVGELLRNASLVGAREPHSYSLALELGARSELLAQTVDDAFFLKTNAEDEKRVSELAIENEYILASFTSHAGRTGWSQQEYCIRIARVLDALAVRFSLPVYLVAHMGVLDGEGQSHDQISNNLIVEASITGRISSLPVLTAREVIALTRSASLNLSSRYHAAIFGTAAGVPSIGLGVSHYSSVKLHGALGNMGLSDFVIPAASWRPELVVTAAEELQAEPTEFAKHMEQGKQAHLSQSDKWWDNVVQVLQGRPAETPQPAFTPVPSFNTESSWRTEVTTIEAMSTFMEPINLTHDREAKRAQGLANKAQSQLASMREELESLQDEVEKLKARINGSDGSKNTKRKNIVARIKNRINPPSQA